MTPEDLASIRRSASDPNLHAWDHVRPVVFELLDWIDTLQTDRRVTDASANFHMLRARDLQKENDDLKAEIAALITAMAQRASVDRETFRQITGLTRLRILAVPPPAPNTGEPSSGS
jgi:hypothetical protein